MHRYTIIPAKKLLYIHKVNGDRSKTVKIIKDGITDRHIV